MNFVGAVIVLLLASLLSYGLFRIGIRRWSPGKAVGLVLGCLFLVFIGVGYYATHRDARAWVGSFMSPVATHLIMGDAPGAPVTSELPLPPGTSILHRESISKVQYFSRHTVGQVVEYYRGLPNVHNFAATADHVRFSYGTVTYDIQLEPSWGRNCRMMIEGKR